MITTRSVAIAAFYSIGLILGAGGALAQSTNFDNTSLGESGHGTGCSNEPIGAAGDTNCRHQTVPLPNGSPASAGAADKSTTMFIPSRNNPDNTSPGEAGHGTGCSNPSARSMSGAVASANCNFGSSSN